ncbi:hypothetical protein, partial [Salmonella enterica]
MADHRWILASSRIGDFLLELARALGVDVPADTASGIDPARMAALLDDLTSHQGRSLIAVGR